MKNNKEGLILGAIYASVSVTIITLLLIVGFVFINGYKSISFDFLTSGTRDESVYVTFEKGQEYDFSYNVKFDENDAYVEVSKVRKIGQLHNNIDEDVKLESGQIITKINGNNLRGLNESEIKGYVEGLKNPVENTKVKLTTENNGIWPLIVTTLFVILIAISISLPIGLCSAIFLIEYKINPRLNTIIHFAIDSLAGIPSIIFGLFGFIFFSVTLGFGISLISGILTISIMLLPIIIKTIEEAIIAVPQSLRESSYGLGASKAQTIFKVVIPTALPGILVASILAIGRIIGESAIFIFTAGTIAQMPSLFDKATTLTVYAYSVTREFNDIQTACAIGIVIIVIVLVLNVLTKIISKKMMKG